MIDLRQGDCLPAMADAPAEPAATRRAILVLGAESSGTRCVTSLLVKAGAYGDTWHSQRLDADDALAAAPDLIVLRRSVPHGGCWEFVHQSDRLRDAGYAVTVVVTNRDGQAMRRSQVHAQHVPTVGQADTNIAKAYSAIWGWLEYAALPFRIASLESLRDAPARRALLASLGLPDVAFDVGDSNAKHW